MKRAAVSIVLLFFMLLQPVCAGAQNKFDPHLFDLYAYNRMFGSDKDQILYHPLEYWLEDGEYLYYKALKALYLQRHSQKQ